MAEMKDVFAKAESKMKKSIDHLMEEFDSIRAGRANPAVLDHIMVNYYDTPPPSTSWRRPRGRGPGAGHPALGHERAAGIERPSRPPTWASNPQNDGKGVIRPGVPAPKRRAPQRPFQGGLQLGEEA